MKNKLGVIVLKSNLKPNTKPRTEKTKSLTPLPKLLAKTQQICNEFIRKRDQGKPCISCGRYVSQMDAGHHFSMGHYTALRFDERNIHAQCPACNRFGHGNLINYRKGLLKRYGIDFVERLELSAELRKTHKWERIELEALIQEFKQKIKSC